MFVNETGGLFGDLTDEIVGIFTGGGGGGGGSPEPEPEPDPEATPGYDEADDMSSGPGGEDALAISDLGAAWAEFEAAGCGMNPPAVATFEDMHACYLAAVAAGHAQIQPGTTGPGAFHMDNLIAACAAGGSVSCSQVLQMALNFPEPLCEKETIESWNPNIACDCSVVNANGSIGACWEREPLTLAERAAQQRAKFADIPPPQEGGIGSVDPWIIVEPPQAKVWPWVAGAGAVALAWYLVRRP